jgi:outer membrane protein assembly factor BamB
MNLPNACRPMVWLLSLLSITLLIAQPAAGQPGTLLWEDRYDASGFEQAFAVATVRGRVVVAGDTSNNPPRRDFLVRAYDGATGALAWQDQVNRGNDDIATGAATDRQRVFVSGTTFSDETGYDWILRAYDAETGNLLWEDIFDHVGRSDFSRGTALAAGSGLVFLGGYGTNEHDTGDFNTDYIVRAYDAASGALVWQDQLAGFSLAYALTFEGGRLFVGGSSDTAEFDQAIVRAYDASSGRLLWDRRTRGAAGFGQTWTSTIEAEGDIVVAGQPHRDVAAPHAMRPLVQAYDARNGTSLWREEFSTGDTWAWLHQIDLSGGQVVAAGFGGPSCNLSVSDCDTLVRSYSARSGALRWERLVDMSEGSDDYARLVTVEAGTVFVLAYAQSTYQVPNCCTIGRWVVQALSSAHGELLWQTVEGDRESGTYNMAVDRGRLFIPGFAIDPATSDWDFIVRAYDARGRKGAIEPVFPAPPALSLTGASGLASYDVAFDTPVTATVRGLIAAEEQANTVVNEGVVAHTVTVPAGTRLLRVGLFDDETDGQDDLDLYLRRPDGSFVPASAGPTTAEHIDLSDPIPGTYTVYVHGYATDGPDANYTLFAWTLGEAAEGNLTVTPEPAAGTMTVEWSGLTPGLRYFGMIGYSDGNQTVITVAP